MNQGIDFELFRDLLETKLSKFAKDKGGRPPFDYVLMFKILILQRYYNLLDDQEEYQINDRMSFMRFLDLTIADDIPDSKTVWHFREQVKDLNLAEDLFALFLSKLEALNLVINEGKIIDASFVEVPQGRNTREENKQIKNGETPDSFKENPHKASQKDIDARWTQKNNVNFFGFKNYVKQDAGSKLITKYVVTDASVHDSQATDYLLDEKDIDEPFFADSAYIGESQEKIIRNKEMLDCVCEKGYRNKPLTEEQKESNKEKSRIRSRVEHFVGFLEMSMNGMYIQCIGLKRANTIIGLMNLTYNMYRSMILTSDSIG